jgi:hypothetical protein
MIAYIIGFSVSVLMQEIINKKLIKETERLNKEIKKYYK